MIFWNFIFENFGGARGWVKVVSSSPGILPPSLDEMAASACDEGFVVVSVDVVAVCPGADLPADGPTSSICMMASGTPDIVFLADH